MGLSVFSVILVYSLSESGFTGFEDEQDLVSLYSTLQNSDP